MTNRSLSSTLDRMWSLNRAIDQALSAGVDRTSRGPEVWVPSMDVAEKADAYLINVELPGVDRIEASYSHGLLRIIVPKAQAAQPRKIEIRTGTPEEVRAN